MKAKFRSFMTKIGEAKGEPQSDSDGGQRAKVKHDANQLEKKVEAGSKKLKRKASTAKKKIRKQASKWEMKVKKHAAKVATEKLDQRGHVIPSGTNVQMVLPPLVSFDFNQEAASANKDLDEMSKVEKERLLVNKLSKILDNASH